VEVIILGSGTGAPSLKRGAPGLLIKIKDELLLFDSGNGTLEKLLKLKIDYTEIDYIFYTHFHPDHIAELMPLLFANKYGSKIRTKPLIVIGPKGMKNLYENLLNAYGKRWLVPENYKIEIKDMDDVAYKGENWKINSEKVNHIDPSVGYRFETKDGKVVVYSGDTDYCHNIVKLARNADLFISECSFPDELYFKGHLTPSLAGKIARESECGHLVLTHLYPICNKYNIRKECRNEYKGRLTVAKDMLKIRV